MLATPTPRTLLLLVLAACSKVGGPHFDKALAAKLALVAPTCASEPSPNGPGGYDSEVTCHGGDSPATMVHVLIADDRIGELAITLVEPSVEAAIGTLRPALVGTCDGADFDAIAAALRRARPMKGSDRPTKVDVRGKPLVGIEQDAPGGPITVQVSFDYRKN